MDTNQKIQDIKLQGTIYSWKKGKENQKEKYFEKAILYLQKIKDDQYHMVIENAENSKDLFKFIFDHLQQAQLFLSQKNNYYKLSFPLRRQKIIQIQSSKLSDFREKLKVFIGIYSLICRDLNNIKEDKNCIKRDLSWYVVIKKDTDLQQSQNQDTSYEGEEKEEEKVVDEKINCVQKQKQNKKAENQNVLYEDIVDMYYVVGNQNRYEIFEKNCQFQIAQNNKEYYIQINDKEDYCLFQQIISSDFIENIEWQNNGFKLIQQDTQQTAKMAKNKFFIQFQENQEQICFLKDLLQGLQLQTQKQQKTTKQNENQDDKANPNTKIQESKNLEENKKDKIRNLSISIIKQSENFKNSIIEEKKVLEMMENSNKKEEQKNTKQKSKEKDLQNNHSQVNNIFSKNQTYQNKNVLNQQTNSLGTQSLFQNTGQGFFANTNQQTKSNQNSIFSSKNGVFQSQHNLFQKNEKNHTQGLFGQAKQNSNSHIFGQNQPQNSIFDQKPLATQNLFQKSQIHNNTQDYNNFLSQTEKNNNFHFNIQNKQTNRLKDDIYDFSDDEVEQNTLKKNQNRSKTYSQNIDFEYSYIMDFEQMKYYQSIFVSRKEGCQIQPLQFQNKPQNFQIADNQNKLVIPRNMHMLQQDQKIICTNENKKGNAYLLDIETQQVVRQYQDDSKNIKDLTVLNEKDLQQENNRFITLGSSSIQLFDIREKKVVKKHNYKSVKDFTHIISPSCDNFLILSQNGILRFYDDVGKIAKNKIETGNKEESKGFDTNIEGDTTMIIFPSCIFLYVSRSGRNAYNYNFKNQQKPKLRKLMIDGITLAQQGIHEYQIESARFDEKINGQESKIIAVLSDNILAFWNLEDIKNNIEGSCLTKDVRLFEQKPIKSEFVFNKNQIVTAFDKNIEITNYVQFNYNEFIQVELLMNFCVKISSSNFLKENSFLFLNLKFY